MIPFSGHKDEVPFSGHRPCIQRRIPSVQFVAHPADATVNKNRLLQRLRSPRVRAEKALRTLSECRAACVKPFERDLFHVPNPLEQTMFMRGVSDYGGGGWSIFVTSIIADYEMRWGTGRST